MKQGITAQSADQLLDSIEKLTEPVQYHVKLALRYIHHHIDNTSTATVDEIISTKDLPTLSSIYVLDVILAKVQVVLDNYTQNKSAVSIFVYSEGTGYVGMVVELLILRTR